MTWLFFLWLVSFVGAAALLGINMYTLICLSDLENDFINPHDSASRVNTFVVPEMLLQGALTAAYLLTGRWFVLVYNLPMLAWHVRLYLRKEALMDVTEIFNQLSREKKHRLVKLFFYLFFFVFVIFRAVEAFVAMIVVSHGK